MLGAAWRLRLRLLPHGPKGIIGQPTGAHISCIAFHNAFSRFATALHSHRAFGDFICSDPELLIFRRFDLLNARALLYMQSDVQCLSVPRRRVWEAFSGWFRQNQPFFGQSRSLVDNNPRCDFVAVGVTEDQDVLTRFIEYLMGCAVAVGRFGPSLKVG